MSVHMIGQTLGHYRILEKIGQGGMGVVYRANDERLDRNVALKVLPPGTLTDETARRRFHKEALVLARLSHPNIGVIHDFNTKDGVDFLVMEYIAGSTLAAKLAGRCLPEKEVVALGAQITAALEEAHEHGVVHFDLKPGNVMVAPKGQAKVLDFGLAKLLRPPSDAATTESFTDTLGAAGTLPYMAPEQLRGEPADARMDLYALGCVLYEMATGQRAFADELATRLTDSILHQMPTPPSKVNRKISSQLEHIILKCMEKDPENRYQSAKELVVDLRRLGAPQNFAAALPARRFRRREFVVPGIALSAVLAILGLLVALNLGGWRERLLGDQGAGVPHIQSLAVLPLENLSSDPEQDYFADGMTDALIADLGRMGTLRVISRTSVMRYKGTSRPLREIARELNVDALLVGSVLRSGKRVRITPELVQAATEHVIWSDNIERDLRDVVALQNEVAWAIAGEVRVKLPPPRRLATTRSVDPQAYDAYLRGRFLWYKGEPEGLTKSIQYFEQAITIDPNYASAYAGVADYYAVLPFSSALSPKEALPKAKAAAMKALEIDNTLAEAHNSLAQIQELYDWDWVAAQSEYHRAIELNPSLAWAHFSYAYCLGFTGQFDEAVAEMKRAQELDPLSPSVNLGIADILQMALQQDQAIKQYRRTLELEPSFTAGHLSLGIAYEQQGMLGEAIAEMQEAIAISGDVPLTISSLAHAYAVSGKRGRALSILNRLKDGSRGRYISAYNIAIIYAGLADKTQACAWLEKAYEERSVLLVWLKVDTRLDPLRGEPSFQNLMRHVGLQP